MRAVHSSPVGWSDEELIRNLWFAGELGFLCRPHQVEVYERFHRWNGTRNSPEHQELVRRKGLLFDNVFMLEICRRYGKTALSFILGTEAGIRRPGAQGMMFTTKKEYIGNIYVPMVEALFASAPEGYKPRYRESKSGLHEGFEIRATGSYIKLVGLDVNPEATRGQFQDFVIGTEAAFVRDLADTWTSVITHQMQKRPWAWGLLESSTARTLDADFNRVFREDCRARGAYVRRTFHDDVGLTEEEKEKEIRRTGGLHSVATRRELFCEVANDVEQLVTPEFSEEHHVVVPDDWSVPEHALCYVGLDPGGKKDPVGLVFFHLDFHRQKIVVTGSWMGLNRPTYEIADDVIKPFELELWGTQHRRSPKPREPSEERQLLDLLKPPRDAEQDDGPDIWQWIEGERPNAPRVLYPPPNTLTYWDDQQQTLRPNPILRVMDISSQMQTDLQHQHGLLFRSAKKGQDSRDQHVANLRRLLREDKIRVVKNGRTNDLIAQLRSLEWNDKHDDFVRTPALGHGDAMIALAYALRLVDLAHHWDRNPFPPKVRDLTAPGIAVSPRYQKMIERIAPGFTARPKPSRSHRFESNRSPKRFSRG